MKFRAPCARFYRIGHVPAYFISWVVVGYFVYAFLNVDQGILNQFLARFGIEGIAWYRKPDYWPAILVITSLWKGVGYGSLLYLAIMLGISPEYYEAAKIDGATKIQQILYITLPHLIPVVIILTMFAIAGIFRSDFGLFFNVTRNQPALYPTTDVIDTLLYTRFTPDE